MTFAARWRSLLRRLGIGEGRWISDPEEREAHRARVRRRLRHNLADEPEPPRSETPPDRDA